MVGRQHKYCTGQEIEQRLLHVLVEPSHDTATSALVTLLETVTEPGAMESVPFAYELHEAVAAGRACTPFRPRHPALRLSKVTQFRPGEYF